MLLESTAEIYRGLSIKDMRVVNMNGGGEGNDPAAGLLGQMITGYKSISDAMDTGDQNKG